jgi:hypothetical protein
MKSAPTNTTKSDPVLTLNLAKSFATVSPGKLMNIKGTIPNIPNSTKIKLYLKGSSGEVFIKEAQVFYTPVAGGDAYGIKSPLGLPFTLPKNTLAGTYTLRGVITLSDGTVVEDESDSFNVKLQ